MGCSHGLQWAVCIQCAWQLAFIVLVISPSDRSVNNNTRRKFQLGRANFQLAWKCFTCRAASLCRCVLTVLHHIASHRGEMSKMCEMNAPPEPTLRSEATRCEQPDEQRSEDSESFLLHKCTMQSETLHFAVCSCVLLDTAIAPSIPAPRPVVAWLYC